MNFQVWIMAALSGFALGAFTFFWAYRLRKNDLADVIWGPGFLVAAFGGWYLGAADRAPDLRLFVALLLVCVWGGRLFLHIGLRSLKHREEDVRYQEMRRAWGANWVWRSYLQVFLLQGIVMLVIDAPLLWIISAPPQALDLIFYLGVVIWVVGFLFESISDEQLRQFKANPENRGLLMTSGLWGWSRHPNYFGEVLQWWGVFLLAAPLPYGLITIISPIAITFFILKVSGVPLLEKLMKDRPGAAEYRKNVPIFFPAPPKKRPPA
jgi:steroid 5-alpha reductase family enzyme